MFVVDFADFAAAPQPVPVSIPASPADANAAQVTDGSPVLYTKWYRVWERTSMADFKLEMMLLPFVIVAVILHLWGTRKNTKKARKWMAVHLPVLESEFALVGYGTRPKMSTIENFSATDNFYESCTKLAPDNLPAKLLKEKTAYEFQSYASGRQNIAFTDFKVILHKRFNPLMMFSETILGMFFEYARPPAEKMQAITYCFDGNEKEFVPPPPGSAEPPKIQNSSYDNFIFAVVNKMSMRRLRDERYDVSLTYTKDHPKLPGWATAMSESAEISDLILTKELVSAIEKCGDRLEYLIISDQPPDKPTTLAEMIPKKRLHLSIKLPSSDAGYAATLPLFHAFLRLPDQLVSTAHFRPEVIRKVKEAREQETKKVKKVGDEEKEDERRKQAEKIKKEERERKMRGMSAEDQRKFLEKEAELKRKRGEKKMTRKG